MSGPETITHVRFECSPSWPTVAVLPVRWNGFLVPVVTADVRDQIAAWCEQHGETDSARELRELGTEDHRELSGILPEHQLFHLIVRGGCALRGGFSFIEGEPEDDARRFKTTEHEGEIPATFVEMMRANPDDEDLAAWLRAASVGDWRMGIVSVECVAVTQ